MSSYLSLLYSFGWFYSKENPLSNYVFNYSSRLLNKRELVTQQI